MQFHKLEVISKRNFSTTSSYLMFQSLKDKFANVFKKKENEAAETSKTIEIKFEKPQAEPFFEQKTVVEPPKASVEKMNLDDLRSRVRKQLEFSEVKEKKVEYGSLTKDTEMVKREIEIQRNLFTVPMVKKNYLDFLKKELPRTVYKHQKFDIPLIQPFAQPIKAVVQQTKAIDTLDCSNLERLMLLAIEACKKPHLEVEQVRNFINRFTLLYRNQYRNGRVEITGSNNSKISYALKDDPFIITTWQRKSTFIKGDEKTVEIASIKPFLMKLDCNMRQSSQYRHIFNITVGSTQTKALVYVGTSTRLFITHLVNMYCRMYPKLPKLLMFVKIYLRSVPELEKIRHLINDEAVSLLVIHVLHVNKVVPNLMRKKYVDLDEVLRLSLERLNFRVIKDKRRLDELFFMFINYYADFDWHIHRIHFREQLVTKIPDRVEQKTGNIINISSLVEPFNDRPFFNILANKASDNMIVAFTRTRDILNESRGFEDIHSLRGLIGESVLELKNK